MNLEEKSKEELIDYINNLDENNNGKYALRWDNEKEPETIVEECNKKIPVLKEIESIPDANSYDKLVAYNGVFMLLYDQRKDFAQAGIDSAEIISLIDTINTSAGKLDVKKEQTKKLQTEIVENYSVYREAIERA